MYLPVLEIVVISLALNFGNKIWIVFEIELDYKHKVFYAKLKITYGTNFTFSILT